MAANARLAGVLLAFDVHGDQEAAVRVEKEREKKNKSEGRNLRVQ